MRAADGSHQRRDSVTLFIALREAWETRNTSWSADLCRPMVMHALATIAERAPANGLVLDAGCGDGHMTSILTQAGLRCVGVDLSCNVAREAATQNPDCAYGCANVESLPFADQSFDIVYTGSVLQYAERDLALREMARVLRRGGLLVAIENLHGSPIARLARMYLRIIGAQHPPHLTPKHHLHRRELSMYALHLRSVTSRVFNLLAPSLYVANRFGMRFSNGSAARGKWYRYLHAMDRRLLNTVPALEHLSWHIVICGEK